jgi:hypothetical protein
MRYIHKFKLSILLGCITAILVVSPKAAISQIQLTVDGITYVCFDNFIDYESGLLYLGDCHGTIAEIEIVESYQPLSGSGGTSAPVESWSDPGGSGGGGTGGNSADSGESNTGTTGDRYNLTYTDKLLCPCCMSDLHSDCECEYEDFDPYNISYHDKKIWQTSSEWTTSKIERVVQRSLIGLLIDFIFGVYTIVIEEFFENGSTYTKPGYLIHSRLTIDYVRSYNWSGKVRVLKKHLYKISSLTKYSSHFKENRQVGKAMYEQAILNTSTMKLVRHLWEDRVGFPGSLADLRCGEPAIGEYYFFNCNL